MVRSKTKSTYFMQAFRLHRTRAERLFHLGAL
jgi:hypothetical protein